MDTTPTETADETSGAWIVHHGQKLQADQDGASEFPALDGAAKSGLLLARLAASEQSTLGRDEVVAVAKNARLNPKTELDFYLQQLKARHVIDLTANGAVSVLGVNSRQVLRETAKLFEGLEPTSQERAALDMAEATSGSPRKVGDEVDRLSDTFKMGRNDVSDFLRRAQEIGFVDSEGDGTDRLLFNGNLFRREGIKKTKVILDSLKADEQARVNDVAGIRSDERSFALSIFQGGGFLLMA